MGDSLQDLKILQDFMKIVLNSLTQNWVRKYMEFLLGKCQKPALPRVYSEIGRNNPSIIRFMDELILNGLEIRIVNSKEFVLQGAIHSGHDDRKWTSRGQH